MLPRNFKQINKAVEYIILILSMAFFGLAFTAAQAEGIPELFKSADSRLMKADRPDPAHVLRSLYVSVDVKTLYNADGSPRDKQSLPAITLNLFPDVNYTGIMTNVQKENGSTSWTGKLQNIRGSYFYLTIAEGVFIAHIASPEGIYEVSWAGKGVYKVIEIDQTKFKDHPDSPDHSDKGGAYTAPGPVRLAADSEFLGDAGSTIDVMVVYTTTARTAEGSTAAMKARIALAMTETNTSYANSGIAPRLRLVHVQEVNYAESGDLATDVARLANPSDGFMDNVHSLRNTYGADMVSLVVENGGGYCGMADAIMATAATAFQTTQRSGCMTGYYSFGHEFGHLQGARHDIYADSSTTPYSYGHGYVHPYTTDPAERWRTVMAYDSQCNAWGYTCTRLQYWSNPSKLYLSDPMGDTQAKNYQVLNNTAYTVANYRSNVIGNNFTSNFTGTSDSWYSVYGTWNPDSGLYLRSDGEPSTVTTATRDGKYGDLTYQVRMKRSGTCTSCANRILIRGNPASLSASYNWSPSYMFQYSNDGYFSVWEISSTGTSTALKTWTTSSAIIQNDWNILKTVAVNASLKFYINGTLVWSGSDSSLRTGNVGFGFYRDANAGTLLVDSATMSTTATADLGNDTQAVAPGESVSGGNINQSP